MDGMTLKAKLCAAAAMALCASQAGADLPDELICGFSNVEDMIALPDSRWIIGSGIGDAYFQKGGLHLFNQDTATGRKVLFHIAPGARAQAPFEACPAPVDPETFSAHGLGLRKNADGTHNLYVVNHGGRESIEVFRVTMTAQAPRIEWIGCIMTPDTAMPNAVAARSDGSLVMSASFAGETRLTPIAEIAAKGIVMDPKQAAEASKAMRYGALFTWSHDAGWRKVPGSELLGNNGIELAADEKWIFVDSHPGASVTYMPLEPGLGKPREIKLSFHPDNIRYGYDGKLVATGHPASAEEVGACVIANDPHCALGYRSAEIDPKTFAVREVFDGTGTRDFGIATVGLRTRDSLWLGPVRGQCVARVNAASLK
jgi:hypothetical protein